MTPLWLYDNSKPHRALRRFSGPALAISVGTIAPMHHSATAAAIRVALLIESRYASSNDRIVRARAAVGRSIRERRLALELSQFALSYLARVNASELSKLERGRLSRGFAIAQKADAVLSSIERERAIGAARAS